MKRMQQGFTMIELIFVIVIIGILAAVAIPKLAATRDDAIISEILTNARTALGDLSSFYTAQGADAWNNDTNGSLKNATIVPFKDAECNTLEDNTTVITGVYYLCNNSVACLEFNGDDNGILTLSSQAGTGDPVCDAVATTPSIIAMAGAAGTSKIHLLGGTAVQR